MTEVIYCGVCKAGHDREAGCPSCARCRKLGHRCGMVHLEPEVLQELKRRAPLIEKLDGPLGSAIMSREEPKRLYRYTLEPTPWSDGWLMVGVLHNPSVASHEESDPTATRMISFARREGAGRLVMVNLCAWRATDPAELKTTADPIGPENLRIVLEAARKAKVMVVAWGALSKAIRQKTWAIRRQLLAARPDAVCLGITMKGDPCHPLYLKSETPLVPWKEPS